MLFQEDELVAVLSTAQCLEIRGLSETNNKEEKSKEAPNYSVDNEPKKRHHVVIENTDSGLKKRKITHSTDVGIGPQSTTNQVLPQQIPQSSSPKTQEILEVKKEVNQVNIDMNIVQGDQNGGYVRQELSYCQDSSSGFEMSEDIVDREYEGDFVQEGSVNFEAFENVSKLIKFIELYLMNCFRALKVLRSVHIAIKNLRSFHR